MKKLLNWAGIIIGVLLIFGMIFTLSGCAGTEEAEKVNGEETVEGVAEEVVEEKKVPKYEIIEEEDLSYSVVKRPSFRIVVSEDITEEEVRLVAEDIVEKTIGTQDVNAINIFMYDREEDAKGAYTVAKVEWAPDGDWSKAGDVEAGDYSTHEYNIEHATI